MSYGDFVVTWEDDPKGTFRVASLKAQVFDPSGARKGSEFLISQTATNPGVTALANGAFAITWQDYSVTPEDNSPPSIRAQIFGIDPASVVGTRGRVAGTAAIPAGTALDIDTASSADVIFGEGGGTLVLDKSTLFFRRISGFGGGDVIDLSDIAFRDTGTAIGYAAGADNASGTLTVSDGAHTAALALIGQYMAANFALSSNGHGGTLIADNPAVRNNPALVAQSQHA